MNDYVLNKYKEFYKEHRYIPPLFNPYNCNENEPKLVGGFGEKKSNGGTQWYQQDRIYDSEEIAMCHPAQIPNGSYNYQVNENENVRIRKLTPKVRNRGYCTDNYKPMR